MIDDVPHGQLEVYVAVVGSKGLRNYCTYSIHLHLSYNLFHLFDSYNLRVAFCVLSGVHGE